jgi:transcriptional regulator with XRE-family HTH domain
MLPADLAERVHRLREKAGLTQSELANQVGYATSTISKAENFHEGDGMVGARITIIEALTEETVEGPLYR